MTSHLNNGKNKSATANYVTMPMKQPSRKSVIPSKGNLRTNFRGV